MDKATEYLDHIHNALYVLEPVGWIPDYGDMKRLYKLARHAVELAEVAEIGIDVIRSDYETHFNPFPAAKEEAILKAYQSTVDQLPEVE